MPSVRYIIATNALKSERESFSEERQTYVEKLMTFNRKVGELETRLLQIEAPAETSSHRLHPETADTNQDDLPPLT